MTKHKLSPYAADPIKRGETVRKGKRSTRSASNASSVPAVTWPDPPAGWFRAGANKRTALYRKSYGTVLGVPSLIEGKRRKGKPDRWVVLAYRRVLNINEASEWWGMYTTVQEEAFVADNHETVWVWLSIEETNAAATSEPDRGTVTGRQHGKSVALAAAYGTGKVPQQNATPHNHQVDAYRYVFDELTKQ